MKIEWLTPKILSLLIGSILLIAGIFLFIESVTLQNNTLELATIMRRCMKDSCQFLSQESYIVKSSDDDRAVRGNCYSIISADGAYQVSGLFYDSDSYKNIIQSDQASQYINYLSRFINGTAAKNSSFQMLKSLMSREDTYLDYGITPSNLGFTYLDEVTLNKIFIWRLTNELTATGISKDDIRKRNTILTEDGVNYFIKWKNFRIYLNSGVSNSTRNTDRIQVLHITDSSDWDKYSSLTGLTHSYLDRNGITANDIRSYRIVYDVRWTINVGYEGILPMFLVYNVFRGSESSKFDINPNPSVNSVLNGSKYNQEISRFTWDTGRSEPDYAARSVGTLWNNNSYFGLAQKAIFTVIH